MGRLLERDRAVLVVIDVQEAFRPAVRGFKRVAKNVGTLVEGAKALGVPVVVTEQYPKGLGATVPEVASNSAPVVRKMSFDASAAPNFPAAPPERPQLVVVGCEAHVCVLQTVLGLLDQGRDVFVVRDAIGSRRAESKETAIARMERHGAEIVTTEMVVFEWLATADNPRFRELSGLIK